MLAWLAMFDNVSRSVHYGTLNSNESKECERVTEISLIHFNVLKKLLSEHVWQPNRLHG